MHGPNELDPTLAALAEGQRVFGRFTLVRALGRGTLGVVWMARDEAQNRDVELKFLPEVLARDVVTVADLKLEVERVRDLRHDVFQAIYDFYEDGTRAAVSSEFVPGNTLGALCEVRFNGCFDAAELLPWIEPLADAFTLAHRQQLVHRALHPGHLVLTPAGRVKVLDFGIAHALHEASMRRCADKSENATLTYASPQLAAGALPSPEDDVYSLGATLYDLLAGAPPFTTGATMPIAARRAALDRWGAPVPSAWEKVISSCFAKDPAKRPQSIASVIQALREGLNSEPAPARIERAEKKVEPPAAEPESPVEVPLPKTPAVPIAPKVVPEKREEPAAPPVAPVPATRPTSAPVAATLPEVEAARAIQVQRAHHRGVLVALVCLAAAWLAARTMSERGLPPVLPEAPTPPPLRAKGTPVPDSPKLESAPPVVPIPPPATPAPLPAKPEPAPPPATPTPPEPVPTVPVPPPATPTPLPPAPSAATPAPMPIAPTPPPATPAPPPTTPTPATPAPGPRRAEPVPSSTPPKLGARWTNSAGMPFAPVPKIPVLVAIWETRVRDYAAFAKATGLPWKAPADGPECPVGNVSYMDALQIGRAHV